MTVNTRKVPALVAVLVLWAGGCGGEEAINEMPRVNMGAASQAAAPTASAARPGSDRAGQAPSEPVATSVANEMMFDDGARDPFEREFPEGELSLLRDPSVELAPAEAIDLGPLAEYPLESLRLQAIITRTPEPRAMFLVPDGSGLAVLARIGDRVGPSATGQITDIQPNQVEVSYEGILEFGLAGQEQVRTHVVTLRDPARDIEAEFEPY